LFISFSVYKNENPNNVSSPVDAGFLTLNAGAEDGTSEISK